MTQIATVQRLLDGQKAEIMVRRPSACGHDCASCGGCGPNSITQVIAVADNEAGARVGDTVRLESGSGRVLGLAALLYLVPLLLLFVGYFLAFGLLRLGEGASVAVGLLFLTAGFAVNLVTDRRLRKQRPVSLRIVEVMKTCSDM